jgi:HTH-type transcriptional regulator/antitoxin HigA
MNEKISMALAHWPFVAPLLKRPNTEADYQALAESLDAVLDAGGADETHPLASLADYLGNLIEDYEAEHHPVL